jgi:hypothetical protein
MKLALMECGRKLGTYLRKRQKMRREGERRDVFERYIGEISKAIHEVTGEDQRKVFDALLKQAKARTAVADHVLDEDGRIVKDEPMDEDGVIVVPGAIAPVPGAIPAAAPVAEAAPTKGARRRAAEGTDSRRAAKPGKASAAREELRARVAKSASRGKGGPAAPGLF